MSYFGTSGIVATDLYTAQATSTKAEVTDDPNSEVWGFSISNGTAALAYLQVFDLDADAVTVGSTAPTYAIGVPAGEAICVVFPKQIIHQTGFTIASTTTRTGSSNAAQEVTIFYTHRA